MTADELTAAMKACTCESIAVTHKQVAASQLLDAAVFQGDAAECRAQREKLHTLLDVQLDIKQRLMVLTRRFIEMQG